MHPTTKQPEEILANKPHQLGEFWIGGVKNTWDISISDFQSVAKRLGFCLYRGDIHQIQDGYKLSKSTEAEFFNSMRNYIEDVGQVNFKGIIDVCERFMQKSGVYVIKRLPEIKREQLLNDTKDYCYKFFQNGFVKITPKDFTLIDYKLFPKDKFVLENKIAPREFNPQIKLDPSAKYLSFLKKATDWDTNEAYIKSVIGYLCHEYKDETMGYIIVLTEQCADPKDGGGSGKNLFCNLLSHATSYHSKNGSQVKYDEKFFQSWNGERIMGVSDVLKNFNYIFLKEPSTGTFILKKLFKNEVEIPVQDGPKFIIQTNYSYETSDAGLNRRIIPIEFTDFFTKQGGVDTYFKCHFPLDWTQDDWADYHIILIESIKIWLQMLSEKKKIKPVTLSQTGWEKQFEIAFTKLVFEFIETNWEGWVKSIEVETHDIQEALKSHYNLNDVDSKFRASPQKVSAAIKEYAKYQQYSCDNKGVKEGKKYYKFIKL